METNQLATSSTVGIIESVNTLTGTVTGITRGMRGGIAVQVETEHGYATIPLPMTHAKDYTVGSQVVISIGEVRT